FLDIIGDRLRKPPKHSRNLLQLPVHRCDEFLLTLMKRRTPLLLGLETDEILGIEETCRVGSVIRPARLTGACGGLWKRTEENPGTIHQPDALGRSGAGSECPAYPYRAFIQMRKKFRPYDPKDEISARANRENRDGQHDGSVMHRPSHGPSVANSQPRQHR